MTTLRFGLMLESSGTFWRFFSGRLHGPWSDSLRDAFWQWLKAWWKHPTRVRRVVAAMDANAAKRAEINKRIMAKYHGGVKPYTREELESVVFGERTK